MADVVSGVASTLLGNLATKSFQEIALACGLKDDVKNFESSLRIIKAYLIDAENKQAKNHSIDEWLKQLREAFDDAGDILDEIEYEAKLNEVIKMYGSICTKDYEFEVFELIMLWMAHGLLQPTREDEDAEDIGKLYIKKLVSTSLLQIDEEKSFFFPKFQNLMTFKTLKMHDLVHDLAKLTMKESSRTRTVVQEGQQEASIEWISDKFNYLRVLHLKEDMELSSFPDDCFATMKKHLRFLFLENFPSLKKLPDSICKLQSLQSLGLYCDSLQELPKNMNKLIYLQYLLLMKIKITSLSSMNIGRFQQLKFLYLFNCSKLVSVPSAVGRLTTLKKLGFFWCEELMNFEDEEEEGKQHVVVNNLNLQLFFIIGSKKLDFLPKWLERATKLQYLSIDKTGIKSLPTRLPMTSLEELYIYRCEELSSLPNMDQTHNLQYLVVYNCPALYARYNKETGPDWSKIAHIPHCKIIFLLETIKKDAYWRLVFKTETSI
ncbi:hypothetical protein S83_037669 [Arachis hypogaea]